MTSEASSEAHPLTTSSYVAPTEALTLEPFIPASLSTRRGRGARRKRGPVLQDLPTLSNFQNTTPDYDRFFIISATNGINLSEIDVIKANTELETCLGGSPKKLTELKSGGLLLEVTSLQQSQRILGLTSLATCDVSVAPHSSLNTCKGTIYFANKPNYSDVQLLDHLKQFKVTDIYRQKRKVDGVLLPTPVYILTFSACRLPETVSVGWIRCPVRLYVPLPRRCFKCQRFGHGARSCRSPISVCAYCSSQPSHDIPCPSPPHCVNCGGPHPVFSKDCIFYTLEKEILQLQSRDHMSYHEAKKIVKSRFNPNGRTYAAATRSPPSSSVAAPASDSSPVQSSPVPVHSLSLSVATETSCVSAVVPSESAQSSSTSVSSPSSCAPVLTASPLVSQKLPAPCNTTHVPPKDSLQSTSSVSLSATRCTLPTVDSIAPAITPRKTSSEDFQHRFKTPGKGTPRSLTAGAKTGSLRTPHKRPSSSQSKRPADCSPGRPPSSKHRPSLLKDYPMPPNMQLYLPPQSPLGSIPVIQGGRFASFHDMSDDSDCP